MAPLLTSFAAAWSRSIYYHRTNFDKIRALRCRKKPIVFAIYHNEFFPLCYLHRNEGIIVVVSASRDGEVIARVLDSLGFNLARGSSSRKGMQAMLAAMRQMHAKGMDAVLTVDGPRGPRHIVKPGIVYLASKIQAHIVPARVRMSNRHVFTGSWDRFKLPWLWSRCEVIYGNPYMLPPKPGSAELVHQARTLENKMNLLLD
ncbi:lysophospholipid acyltransferase family protein [Desulfonatronospira sp.]|uniref:lysophospholipid acyltransferase family protein n=1 Tax=Desulfonatronospira sp. TaxID=1962951 RepID=UPI0025C296B5|nr:lysophospholipid acyltransferase family protein [Desulfonatronospira sp.]